MAVACVGHTEGLVRFRQQWVQLNRLLSRRSHFQQFIGGMFYSELDGSIGVN
ncbi:MAG TPA: hypothetical protein VGK99_01200 [Acidobacteriota bacterium]